MSTIELQNIGPLTHVSIPVPEQGGLVVLRGRNGKGKTTALRAVESLIDGKGRPPLKDGSLKGSAEGLGVAIRVGKATTRKGELEVQSLEGALSVADLVDPKIKDPAAADARRVKALVTLAKVEPSESLFYDLLGGEDRFGEIVGGEVDGSDLATMADKIKRQIEAAAREAERAADGAEGRQRGALEAAGDVDIDGECDDAVLQAALESAVGEESALKSRAEAAEKARERSADAKARLAEAEAEYVGRSSREAVEVERKAEEAVSQALDAVRAAEEVLAKAQEVHRQAGAEFQAAILDRKHAEAHERLVAQWREQLEAEQPAPVPVEELEASRQRVADARAAIERGSLIRRAKTQRAKAAEAELEAAERRKEAERLRKAAKATDGVLSGVVAQTGSPLRVEDGRLVLDTARGATYFGDLSQGERYKIALDIAIEAVGPGGVLVIPQEGFEGLDPVNRREVAKHVLGRGVVVLTAECGEGEDVEAEVYGAED